jgi:hypothetical protein
VTAELEAAKNAGSALLLDERELLGLHIAFAADGRASVEFRLREAPDEAPAPSLSVRGLREPTEGWLHLLEGIWGLVSGEVLALRHDPVSDGLSIELRREAAVDGDDRFEVVLWLDLVRKNAAFRARGMRGRQRAGLRFFTRKAQLERFREEFQRAICGGPGGGVRLRGNPNGG